MTEFKKGDIAIKFIIYENINLTKDDFGARIEVAEVLKVCRKSKFTPTTEYNVKWLQNPSSTPSIRDDLRGFYKTEVKIGGHSQDPRRTYNSISDDAGVLLKKYFYERALRTLNRELLSSKTK